MSAEFLVIDGYCFRGTKEDLKVAKNCYELDTTMAEVNLEKVSVTSEELIVKVKAKDNESHIKEIRYEIGDEINTFDSYDINEIEVSKQINGLKENTEYTLKVTVTNENNLKTIKTLNFKTDSLGTLLVKYDNEPNNESGYYQSQEVYLNYSKKAAGYYIKTKKEGKVEDSPSKVCGNGTLPSECQKTNNLSKLEANNWYYFDDSPRIIYDETANETSTIYAIATDGYNITGISTGTLGIIDVTSPTCELQHTINGVTFESKNDINLETYGLSTSDSSVYNKVDSLGLSTSTFYGYVKDKAGNTGKCTTEVTVPSSVSVSPTSSGINVGATVQLTATVSPSNSTYQDVTWTSSNTGIATVSSSGLVTGKAPGTATITVKTFNGKTATSTITVSQPATGISVSPTSGTIDIGKTIQLSATVSPSNATNKSVSWTSSNTGVATVSSSGLVTGKAAGSVTITAKTHNGKAATSTITVKDPVIYATSVSVSPSSGSIYPTKTIQLSATVNPSNTTNKSVSWSSSNTSVATVSSSGLVTAKAAGSVTITAKAASNGKTGTAAITVNAFPTYVYAADNISNFFQGTTSRPSNRRNYYRFNVNASTGKTSNRILCLYNQSSGSQSCIADNVKAATLKKTINSFFGWNTSTGKSSYSGVKCNSSSVKCATATVSSGGFYWGCQGLNLNVCITKGDESIIYTWDTSAQAYLWST